MSSILSLSDITLEVIRHDLRDSREKTPIVLRKLHDLSLESVSSNRLLECHSLINEIVQYFLQDDDPCAMAVDASANTDNAMSIDNDCGMQTIACLEILVNLTSTTSNLIKHLPNELAVLRKIERLLQLSSTVDSCGGLKPHESKKLLVFLNNYFYEKHEFRNDELLENLFRRLLPFLKREPELIVSIVHNYCGNHAVIQLKIDCCIFNILLKLFQLNPSLDDDSKTFCFLILINRFKNTSMIVSHAIKVLFHLIKSPFFATEIQCFNTALLKFLLDALRYHDIIKDLCFQTYCPSLMKLCENHPVKQLSIVFEIFISLVSRRSYSSILMSKFNFHHVLLTLIKTYHLDKNLSVTMTSVFRLLNCFMLENQDLINCKINYNYEVITMFQFIKQYVLKNVILNKYDLLTTLQIIYFIDIVQLSPANCDQMLNYLIENFEFIEKCSEIHIFVNSKEDRFANDHHKLIPIQMIAHFILNALRCRRHIDFVRETIMFNEDLMLSLVEKSASVPVCLKTIYMIVTEATTPHDGQTSKFLDFLFTLDSFYAHLLLIEPFFMRNFFADIYTYLALLHQIRLHLIRF